MKIRKHCVYTMKNICPACGQRTRTVHPLKFSVSDRYEKYRRIARQKSSGKETM